MTLNYQNQMHIAQQFRREKLRISGNQPPLSPQKDEGSKSSIGLLPSAPEPKRSKTFNAFEFSAGVGSTSDGSMLPGNSMNGVCQGYNADTLSSDPFHFTNGPGSVYGQQSIFPREVSVDSKRLSSSFNQFLGLHGELPSHTPGSLFVSAESIEVQNGMNIDHLSGGSANQQEAFQVCGINQDFHGYHDSLEGNVLLVGPSFGGVFGSHQTGSREAPVAGVQLPAHAFSQVQLPQQTTMAVMPHPEQTFPSNVLVSHMGNHKNPWQTGGGELLFVPMSGRVEPDQERRTEPSQNLDFMSSSVPGYGMKHSSVLQGTATGLTQDGLRQSLHIRQSQDPNSGPFQGLSLSLSSHQPSAVQLNSFQEQIANPELPTISSMFSNTVENAKMRLSQGFSDKFQGLLNPLNNSKDIFPASDIKPEDRRVLAGTQHFNHSSGSSMLSSSPRQLVSSRYFKVAQHILDEVCSVVVPMRRDGSSSEISGNKHQEQTHSQSSPYNSTQTEKMGSESSKKNPMNSDGSATISMSRCSENVASLTQEDRVNLQTRKAKLMSMLQEVDKQYRQYYDHMQGVIFSFDSAVGQIGAAQPYTRMALKAISRHFRSLRDTISNQIKATCKALGEEDVCETTFRKVTSRLKFVDQQLRQQRALQQIGILQQPAWRPQRGLPEHSVSILRAWLFENFLHPYPKDADKALLARQTGLSKNQVSNWFINARVRLWKPMVEEMYLEENKEKGQEVTDKANQRKDQATKTQQKLRENSNGDTMHNVEMIQDDIQHIQKDREVNGKSSADDSRHLGSSDTKIMKSDHFLPRITQADCTNGQPTVSSSNSGVDDGSMNKAKDMSFRQDVPPTYGPTLLHSTFGKNMDFRSKDSVSDILYGDDYRAERLKRCSNYPLTVQRGTVLDHPTPQDACDISDQNLNVYSQMAVTANVFDSRAVSLTLGLQHIDPLSRVHSNSNYIQAAHSLSEPNRSHDFRLNVVSHTGNLDHNHEGLNFESGKYVANHLVHEFVS